MVKAEHTVGRGLATSAYRKRFEEDFLECGGNPAKVEIGEAAGTIEFFDDAAHLERHAIVAINSCIHRFLGPCIFGQFVDQLCAEPGQIKSFHPEVEVFLKAGQIDASEDALVHEFLRSLQSLVLTVNQALSGRDHLVCLLFREVLHPNGAVQAATENHIVLGIGKFGLGLLETSPGDCPCSGHAPQPFNL